MAIRDLSDDLSNLFWRFVRGDMEAEAFEAALYASSDLEAALGPEDFQSVISVDFRDAKRVADFKVLLSERLPKPSPCNCHSLPSTGTVRFGQWSYDDFEVIDREVDGLWWLHRMKCRACGTIWRVAAEERIYDVWLINREPIADQPQIQTYHGLLEAARIAGATVFYAETAASFEIPAAIRDLAEERPGISCSEIERLLPVPAETARRHAKDVSTRHKLMINFEA